MLNKEEIGRQNVAKQMCVSLKNCTARLFLRVLPLFTAMWTNVDMGLDINQSITYYKHSYDENSTYHLWAIEYRNITKNNHLHTVSPWYFYVACIVWLIPPILFSFAFMWLCDSTSKDYGGLCDSLVGNKNLFEILKECVGGTLCSIVMLPVGVMFCYILSPLMALYDGIEALFRGRDPDKYSRGRSDHELAEIVNSLKMLECIGEAIPQLLLSVIYIANNYPYLRDHDDYLGLGIPVSIISSIFSLGSVLYGILQGRKACLGCQNAVDDWKDN